MKNQYVGKISVGEVLSYVLLTIVLVFCIMPLIFMATAAFMDAQYAGYIVAALKFN